MKRSALFTLLAAAAAPAPALAQETIAADPRFLAISSAGDELLSLETPTQSSQTILFAPGERIVSVLLSDQAAYSVAVAPSGDSIALRANGMRSLAIMSVETDLRTYEFQLTPDNEGRAPAVVLVRYTQEDHREAESPAVQLPRQEGLRYSYRLKGDRTVQPATISDDGVRTYIEWNVGQPMPATFAIARSGEEEMVDGYVRFGVYTIDRVFDRLVFRIDQDTATAQRKTTGKGRRDRD